LLKCKVEEKLIEGPGELLELDSIIKEEEGRKEEKKKERKRVKEKGGVELFGSFQTG